MVWYSIVQCLWCGAVYCSVICIVWYGLVDMSIKDSVVLCVVLCCTVLRSAMYASCIILYNVMLSYVMQ